MNMIFILLTVAAGLFFYWLRGRFRLIYGMCEIAVALAIISLTFYPPTYYLAYDMPSFFEMLLSKSVGVLGGIYVMVRGLDNMDMALPTRWHGLWDRIFCKRPTQYE